MSSSTVTSTMLKFAAFSSDIELSFYTSLASNKINHDKLDDSAKKVLGLYEISSKEQSDLGCPMQIRGNALTNDDVPSGLYRAEGMIRNVNTIEDYRKLDKAAILNRAGRTIWEAINDGTIYSCPSLLASFTVVCFADLKKYMFHYHFGFPAIHVEATWRIQPPSRTTPDSSNKKTDTVLARDEASAFVDRVQTWRYSVDSRQWGFFLAKKVRGMQGSLEDVPDRESDSENERQRPQTPLTPGQTLDFRWVIGSLSKYEENFFDGVAATDRYICFADPSTYDEHPGWMLRNLLALARTRWKLEAMQILCYRETQSRRHAARSKIISVELDRSKAPLETGSSVPIEASTITIKEPKITGWERNLAGKLASKISNLGEYMDPQRLADQAVDLNLKLIKWRIAPGLDLDKIKNTSCLLLGAGTLGSYVARNLMGWGVRQITFVDNGSVSFSNPVRQPLFNFQDCLGGGAQKAPRAADALKEIYPGVQSAGHVLSVPMAGHPVMDEAKVKADFDTLSDLVDKHDVIFLLMDTRESRWLPTVMGKAKNKIVVNAALGFDSFLVMRHGYQDKEGQDNHLGCYFCNDVVAPADSMTDRTLDQQCTVTRPGIAAIASALLVEILVSLLQHKQGAMAPAADPLVEDREDDHPLGIVPHQIRGFLSNFRNMVLTGKSYEFCSACSKRITDAYLKDGWEFVKKAMNEPGYVEELSGLAEVQRLAEEAASKVEWDEEEDGAEEEGDIEII